MVSDTMDTLRGIRLEDGVAYNEHDEPDLLAVPAGHRAEVREQAHAQGRALQVPARWPEEAYVTAVATVDGHAYQLRYESYRGVRERPGKPSWLWRWIECTAGAAGGSAVG